MELFTIRRLSDIPARIFGSPAKGAALYAIVMEWPENGQITLKSLAQGSPYGDASVKTIRLLGSKASVRWTRDGNGLHLQLPAQKTGEYAYAFKLSLG